jgi:hypothetical protein
MLLADPAKEAEPSGFFSFSMLASARSRVLLLGDMNSCFC